MKKICLLFLFSGALFLIETARGDAVLYASKNEPELPESLVLASFKLVHPLPKVPEKMMVYKTVDPKISREGVMTLMKAFSLEGEIDDRKRQFVVKDRDRVLEVFKQPGTGYLRFSDNAKLGIEKEAKNLPSEDSATARAKEFLMANGLLPENTFFAGVGYYEFRKCDSDGKIIVQGKSAITIGFGFRIGEIKVEGPGAKAGVVFGEEGEIIGVSKIWREIESDKERKIITPEEAFGAFKKRWPREAVSGQLERAKIKTEVNIKEVYVAYYAEPGCVPQNYIEPVYVFKGNYQTSSKIGKQEIKESDYFIIIIPAIPNE